MENSELVQRLQTQLLDLRTSNCELADYRKFADKKLQALENDKEELTKKLSLETKKNKAISFLPGQSGSRLRIYSSFIERFSTVSGIDSFST